MEQLDQQVHHLKQQIQNPTSFNIIEPSIIRTQFATKRDPSFNSYIQTSHSNDRTYQDNAHTRNRTEDSTDQISIFDAAKYFSDLNDDTTASPMQNGSSKAAIDLASMGRLSSVSSSIDTISNYRGRSFHATPTASSEASWNSRTGLLTNPSGSRGVINVKSSSPNSTSYSDKVSNGYKSSTKWSKIMNPKWFIPPRKCPCSGKKSVQVEERSIVEVKTPRMVDLRRSPSSNGWKSNTSSFYSTRQNSPCSKSLSRNIATNGCSSMNLKDNIPKMIDSLKLVVDDHGNDVSVTSGITSHGFTFPILEDQPVAVKKMFNVISSDRQQLDPSRDSLEVFQPKSHMSPKSRRMSYEEENVSDGSSDLFEIESFSTTTYQCRDSIDGNESVVVNNRKNFGLSEEAMMEVVAPNECYAPSEVSVDWSVTTAEGFDRASLTNFSVSVPEIGFATMRKAAEKTGGGVRKDESNKNGGGLLMSTCRCEKAVSVGPSPVKCPVDGPPPVKVARHVGGRTELKQEVKLGTLAQVGNNGNGKVGPVVGRQRSNLVPMPLATRGLGEKTNV